MVDILCSAASMLPFTPSEAKLAAACMSPCSYREREVILEEGSRKNLGYMLWVLEGKEKAR